MRKGWHGRRAHIRPAASIVLPLEGPHAYGESVGGKARPVKSVEDVMLKSELLADGSSCVADT